jgi:hypothetical protein
LCKKNRPHQFIIIHHLKPRKTSFLLFLLFSHSQNKPYNSKTQNDEEENNSASRTKTVKKFGKEDAEADLKIQNIEPKSVNIESQLQFVFKNVKNSPPLKFLIQQFSAC